MNEIFPGKDGDATGDAMADAPDHKPKDEVTALRERNRALEDELARLRAQQDVFASGVSHDLRAPLRAIDGFAVQLQKRLAAGEGGLEEQTARIRDVVARMAGLLDALILYSRVTRTEARREEVDLTYLADWALMDLGNAHPGVVVHAEVQAGLTALGDERLLRQLLDAAFDNCRRFAGPDADTRLHVSGERDGEGLHLRISDHGIGMELRDPMQPFAPFQRLHGAGQGAGDGMGLAIVSAIVQRHGGRVRMESKPGEGCTLHLFLPDEAAAGVSAL